MRVTERCIETDREFYRRLVKIAIPVIAQSLITTGVNLLDTIMLGQIGEVALSASSLGNQFIMLFMFAIMGISMGSSVLASRYWGAGNMDALRKVITIALRFGILLALIFTVLNVVVTEQIMTLYISDGAVIGEGVIYLRWSTVTYLLVALTTICTNVMRSTGITHVSFIGSVFAFFVNIIANYVFIFGKLGMPRMEIAGAALGTVIARIVECGIVCGYFFWNRRVSYRIRDIGMRCREYIGEFLRISVPVMLSDGLLGIGESVLAMVMGHIGASFVSANAIANVVQRVSTIFITGLSYSGCFLIGQTLGENRVQKAKKQGVTFLLLGFLTGCLAAGVIELVRGPVIAGYQVTEETRMITEQLMNAIGLIVIFRAANSVLTKGVLRGGGDTGFLFVADMTTMWLIAIPLGAAAGLWWQLPAFWVYLCLHADQIIKAVWCVFRLRSGRWMKKVKGAGD